MSNNIDWQNIELSSGLGTLIDCADGINSDYAIKKFTLAYSNDYNSHSHLTAYFMSERNKKKNNWKKQLHTWHWVSSAVSLICLLLFSLTGITLNHADWFESKANVESADIALPKSIVQTVASSFERGEVEQLPNNLSQWIETQKPGEFNYSKGTFEWDEYEIYFKQPVPGGDKWFVVDVESAVFSYSLSHRGVIAWLNDLHKGRNTGLVWKWFINVFAVAIFLFALTGLWLLQIHSKRRPSTWYITASGLLLPAVLVYFI